MSDATLPPPEQPKPEGHKPKPARNWRGFLKEYAIVVIGVLTALAAQQSVEALQNRQRASEARTNIRAEIARNLGEMNRRRATEACLSKRLDEVDGLIAAMAVGKLSQDVLWIGRPGTTTIRDSQYKSASEAGSVSLFDAQEQASYAALYAEFDVYAKVQFEEVKAWADLRTLERHPPSSPALDVMLRSALQQARSVRWIVQATHRTAMTAASAMGVKPVRIPLFSMQSACLALHTPRAEALKLIVQGRPNHFTYDEP